MAEASLNLGEGEMASPLPTRASGRWSLLVGGAAALGIWVAPTRPLFIVAWGVFFAWLCVRASVGGPGRSVRLPLLPMVAGLVTTVLAVWTTPAQPLAALGAAVAGGLLPFHLWVEDLRRRLQWQEFLLLLVCQPGVAWLHRSVEQNPMALTGSLGKAVLILFVVSALVHSGLGLVRKEPTRALSAITFSQSWLLMAGAFAGHIGWESARVLLLSTVAGSFVLMTITGLIKDTYGIERLGPDNGLAEVAPDLHRLFIAMGWLFVGLPGGLAFFAEDLLFHALLEHSLVATFGFLTATALNGIVFYRVYASLFCGPTRPGLRDRPSGAASRRWRVALLTAVTGLVILGGIAPALFM
jgi:NADH:ubiquinone oxidoreductase subunit 4 (subunit M)